MKTIIFTGSNPENHYKAIGFLCEAIKDRKDADHKIFVRSVMPHVHLMSMGCEATDGEKHFIGEHEIIFIPSTMDEEIERLKRTKEVVMCKNGMSFVGEDVTKVNQIIDWLLEKTEDIN